MRKPPVPTARSEGSELNWSVGPAGLRPKGRARSLEQDGAAAHRCCVEQGTHLGLIHRDVSPGNQMLSVDGVPTVIDFGVAAASAVEPHSVVFPTSFDPIELVRVD